MDLKSHYNVKQIIADDPSNQLANPLLGSYCIINLVNFRDPLQALNNINNEHLVGTKLFSFIYDVSTTIVYANRNNYYMIFTQYKLAHLTSPPIHYGWFIFENSRQSLMDAYIEELTLGDFHMITSDEWAIVNNNNEKSRIVFEIPSFPTYTRPWARFQPTCINCETPGTVCKGRFSLFDLDMRRKAKVLSHTTNAKKIQKKIPGHLWQTLK